MQCEQGATFCVFLVDTVYVDKAFKNDDVVGVALKQTAHAIRLHVCVVWTQFNAQAGNFRRLELAGRISWV